MFKGISILMGVAILVITGFQVFWLRENYFKEKKDLEFRTHVVFKETVRKLQGKKLNLDRVFGDSSGRIKIDFADGDHPVMMPGYAGERFTDVLNDVRVSISDSMRRTIINSERRPNILVRRGGSLPDSMMRFLPEKGNMVISMTESYTRDSANGRVSYEKKGPQGEIFRFLYSVDSLQEKLSVSEIDSACRKAFKNEGLNVPFTISSDTSVKVFKRMLPDEPGMMNKVTIGFAQPVTYELSLGNTFGYLLKKLSSPVLFSLFLVGITILSFVLLYRNLQRQRKLTELKNDFIGNITHELKTPIATVGVAIEALRNFNAINDPRRTKEYLDISQNELQRLSLLVDKVLKLSMFEKKEIELKYELIDLKGIVEEVVSSMKLQIEKYHATVSVQADGDTNLQGDRLHLLSVVFNLLDNALKYGNSRQPDETGQGNIAIKFEIKEKGNGVELSVADNGIGILPEYRDKVFEKFFRVPAGDTHNTKGYGLGLSYVAHVIQKHRGNIEVESQPGIGSKFIITLPKEV